MGLGVYKYENNNYILVTEDTLSTIYTVHDGKRGSTRVLQLFLRNDDEDLWYKNITISPEDTVGSEPYGDLAYTETGWGVKLSSQSLQPTTDEWEDINWGDSISMSDIGSDSAADTTTYYPFWYLISSPPNCDAQNKTDINLDVACTSNAVI